ncbi:hypothetical protein C484_12731 [Natrialba taiwanensis DSM 12281]|uniref:Uncharacterized protein n=1 Tax=Natrialba taiwanensis DSM 12281 TaxID=1230458 RepID=L9ZW93_9EURY|nr:hypothetical protein C484_12731 [Natrialba taiwanensis DSM 12281]
MIQYLLLIYAMSHAFVRTDRQPVTVESPELVSDSSQFSHLLDVVDVNHGSVCEVGFTSGEFVDVRMTT